jgi:hypothetical protein
MPVEAAPEKTLKPYAHLSYLRKYSQSLPILLQVVCSSGSQREVWQRGPTRTDRIAYTGGRGQPRDDPTTSCGRNKGLGPEFPTKLADGGGIPREDSASVSRNDGPCHINRAWHLTALCEGHSGGEATNASEALVNPRENGGDRGSRR